MGIGNLSLWLRREGLNMSDEEFEVKDGMMTRKTAKPVERKLIVSVEGGKEEISELKEEIETLTEALENKDNVLNELAEAEFERKKTELAQRHPDYSGRILNVENPSQYEFIKAFLSGEKPQHKSSGVVSLRQTDSDNPLLQSFDSPRKVMQTLYEHALNPKSKYYNRANLIRQHLRKLFNEEPEMPKTIDLSGVSNPLEAQAITELGDKFSYRQYTQWLHKKMKEWTQK